jgi:iron complex transport system permease protein
VSESPPPPPASASPPTVAGVGAGRLVASAAACAGFALVVTLLALALDIKAGPGGRVLTVVDPRAILGDSDVAFTFWTYKVPRILAGLLCGAALAAAGTGFQAVLQNPMAEPYTLGVSSGSALAAVLAIRLGLGDAVGVFAMAGAAATIALVWRLGQIGDGVPAATLLLAGITISMFCGAATMLVQYTADFSEVYEMVRWMMGELDVLAAPVERAAPFIGLGLLVLLTQARAFNALAAGADAAASVGVEPRRAIAIGFVAGSLLVGVTIAVAGPIGFVGLMVPHALRSLAGPDHRVLLPCAMLAGGGFLVLADAVGRVIRAPSGIPVGVVTAILGGPFFLYLLVRERGRRRLWT